MFFSRISPKPDVLYTQAHKHEFVCTWGTFDISNILLFNKLLFNNIKKVENGKVHVTKKITAF